MSQQERPSETGSLERKITSVKIEGLSVASELHPEVNEDAFFVIPGFAAAVFDGVGGAAHGGESAGLAKQLLEEKIGRLMGKQDVASKLGAKLSEVDQALSSKGKEFQTTATVAIVQRESHELVVGNVGDSRLYTFRGLRLRQITLDDNELRQKYSDSKAREVQEKLSGISDKNHLKKLTPEEREFFEERRNIISQSLGQGHVTPRVHTIPLEGDERILLCTDGIHDYLADWEISAILSKYSYGPTAADKLIEAARSRIRDKGHIRLLGKYPDDMTAVVMDINSSLVKKTEGVEVPPLVAVEPPQPEPALSSSAQEEAATSEPGLPIVEPGLPIIEPEPPAPVPVPTPVLIADPEPRPDPRPPISDEIRSRAREGEDRYRRDRAVNHRRRNIINGILATGGLLAFSVPLALTVKDLFLDEGIKTESGRFYPFHEGKFSVDQIPDGLNFFFPERAMNKKEYEMHPADLLLSAGLPDGLIEKFARNGTRIVFADSPGGGDVELRNWLWADKMLSVAAIVGGEARSGILIASADRNGVESALKAGSQAIVGDVSSPGYLLRVRRDAHKSASDAVGGLQNYCSARVLNPLPRNFTSGDLRNSNRKFVEAQLIGHRKLFDELSRYLRT